MKLKWQPPRIGRKAILLSLLAVLIALALTAGRLNVALIKGILSHAAQLPAFRFSYATFLAYLLFVSASMALVFLKDEHLATAVRYRYFIALAAFALLVACKLHMSSIGSWDSVFTDRISGGAGDLLVGGIRAIRSDEWLVNTPYCLAQVQAGFPEVNGALRSAGQNMMIAPGLVLDISAIFRPNFWGYYLLGAEYGMAWAWCFPFILLLLTSYELIRFLTGGNIRLSLLGALFIAFAPPVQWWMQGVTGIIHPIVWSQAAILCTLGFIRSERGQTGKKVLFSVLLVVSLISFTLNIYPAWQVPFLYVMLLFMVIIIVTHWKKHRHGAADIAYIVAVLAVVAVFVTWFVFTIKDVVAIVQNTAYPGARVSAGGDVPIGMLLREIASVKLALASPYNTALANECEASAFITFLPFVLLAFPLLIRGLKHNRGLAIGLFALLLAQLSWMLVKYPDWLANITLMRYVPGTRMMIPFGMTAAYLCFMLINRTESKPLAKPAIAGIVAAAALCYGLTLLGADISKYMGRYFGIAAFALFAAAIFFMCAGWKRSFIALMCAIIFVSGVLVNPVARGLGPIYNKQVSKAVRGIEQRDPGKKWLGIGKSTYYAQYLLANGIHAVNGVHYYPDLELWRSLDPDGSDEEVYNRYAHVSVELTNGQTEFKLKYADAFEVDINADDLKATGACYILSDEPLEPLNTVKTSFQEVYFNAVDKAYVYRVQYSDS